MRYIGGKTELRSQILRLLSKKHLINSSLVFFDAFCGMGSIADAVKGVYDKIVVNDILTCCVTYTKGRLYSSSCTFDKLGFDPFKYFADNDRFERGFISENYTPYGSERMYFTESNGKAIDTIRRQIEEWYCDDLLTEQEYNYLLACLLDAVSSVANTAGVYGAFLKHWDARALKPLQMIPILSDWNQDAEIYSYNSRIEDIISDIECDILYLDPPYTQNQYGTQYHLLETIILDDNPSISNITGSRPTAPMRSDWSKKYKSHILFDYVIANTRAQHIILSYNNDGIMSKEYIESILKRYGVEETYECIEIPYKKYRNFKCREDYGHVEYLFYIRKAETVNFESPLNYTGSKAKMLSQIKAYLPNDFSVFVDVFGGGFNVGCNIDADVIIYNDLNHNVKDLIESFHGCDVYQYLMYVSRLINKYDLKPEHKAAYQKLRDDFNGASSRNPKMLFALIMYGFQQQIRFNGKMEFNNPVGCRFFNDKILAKFVSYCRNIKLRNVHYVSEDFVETEKYISCNTFYYLDPPYRNTTGVYNDGKRGFKGWNINMEMEMMSFLDRIHINGSRFMLSYVLETKGEDNHEVRDWAEQRGYKIINVKGNQGRYNDRSEVLIINY